MAVEGRATATRARLARSVVVANGVGGLAVFSFGMLAPGAPDPEDLERLTVTNAITFVVFMAVALPIVARGARRALAPLEPWLAADRPATGEEQTAALRLPAEVARTSVKVWVAAAVVFTSLSATQSASLAASDAAAALLGGTACCALVYLLAERATRPVVSRALAQGAPPSSLGPSVARRLTLAWTLVTGIPVAGLAAILAADLAGVRISTLTTAAMLLLAIVALVAGFSAMVIAARSVADPVRTMQSALASVEHGEFDTRVDVTDGSEIGRLQAGFNRMAAGLGERERLRDLFGRHVGRDVAAAAMEGEQRLGGEERDVGVLFVDIIGSTALASSRPPTEVVVLLNRFFRLVVETVEQHGGLVNKFEGDGALCVFGAPVASDDPAGDALAAGRALWRRIEHELPELEAGIGVSAGRAVVGNVGAEQRFEYTVIGDPVNEAARLCEMAKRGPERMLAAGTAVEDSRGGERASWALGDEVELRGRAAPTRLGTPRPS